VNGVAAAVVESKVSGGRPVIRFDCEVKRGAELQIERTQLPPLPEDTYYAFQLVGLEVEEVGGRKLGRVKEVVSGVANDVLELDSGLALQWSRTASRSSISRQHVSLCTSVSQSRANARES